MTIIDTLRNFQTKNLVTDRQLKLTLTALAVIFASLFVFYVLAYPGQLEKLADLHSTHGIYIHLTNAWLALICATVLLWPSEGGKFVGGWNRYIGLAFLTFFIQYGLRSLPLALVNDAPDVKMILMALAEVVAFLLSTLNNLLILAAARILLNRKRHVTPISDSSNKKGLLPFLQVEFRELAATLPRWVWALWALLPIPVLGVFLGETNPALLWSRIPDAVFSVYCLGWFGYALYLSFYVRRRRMLARMAFIVVLVYASGQLVFAANPILVYAQPHLILKILDAAIFSILAPMKYFLFLPSFGLYLLSLVSITDFRPALQSTTHKRTDYLSKDGILYQIGNSLEADEVELLVRVPGGNGERAIGESWSAVEKKEGQIYLIKDHPLLKRTMMTEGEIIVVADDDPGSPPQTLVLLPIKFHGGVIGVLRVWFRGFGKYNDATLQQLKFMAELIAPSVQDFRTVWAVEKLGRRFNRATVEIRSGNFTNSTAKIVEFLCELLNPLGIGLDIRWGFTSIKPISPTQGENFEILRKQVTGDEKQKTVLENSSKGLIRIEMDRLSGKTEKGESYYPGTLMLAIPAAADNFAHPTLAAYYLTRRMVASLVADEISTAAWNSLAVVFEELSVALNKETLTIEEWFSEISNAAQKSGILWTVAHLDDDKLFLGDPRYLKCVSEMNMDRLTASPLSSTRAISNDSGARHIICLELTKATTVSDLSKHRLFLGIAREGFGPELGFQSPWRDFLEKVATVAGISLMGIKDRQLTEAKRQREADERLRQAQDEWLKTVAVISAMLMHQLVNMVKNQLDTTEHLLEVLAHDSHSRNGQVYTSLKAMKESAEMMQNLTLACSSITKKDQHGYCSIGESASQAERLFQFALKKRQISVSMDIPDGAKVKIQSNLVTLALASLIGNAIDAIQSKGKIEIRAQVEGDFVLCHVVNSGGPIPEAIVNQLFWPGISGKHGHSGWGLYLVLRSLQEYEGSIFLSYSNAIETCFTLRLPGATNASPAWLVPAQSRRNESSISNS